VRCGIGNEIRDVGGNEDGEQTAPCRADAWGVMAARVN
jgi:hypothetical protein